MIKLGKSGLEVGNGGTETWGDKNRRGVRHISGRPITHLTPTKFHYSLIHPGTVITLQQQKEVRSPAGRSLDRMVRSSERVCRYSFNMLCQ